MTTFSYGLESYVCDGYPYSHRPRASMSLRVQKKDGVAKCVTKYEGTMPSVSTKQLPLRLIYVNWRKNIYNWFCV
jgi:hypothetical protein